MPVTPPPAGNVLTPAGFTIMSAQGQVMLEWNHTPLATEFFIERSTDNIAFTAIAQTASLFYNDTTGVLETIYYYRVKAANISFSSLPTLSLAGLSLKPGRSTVGNLRLESQQRADLVHSSNITNQEWNSMIDKSYKELYDILIQKFGNDYFIQVPYTYLTNGQIDPDTQAQTFPLPDDFYKLMRVEINLNTGDPIAWVTLKKFEAIEANRWGYPNLYTMYGITNLRYRLWGSNLQIVPIASAGQTIRIWYSPRPNQLINDTDVVDAISGWEEYIVADVCIKALAKQEQDPSIFMAQKQALIKRIEEAAENRDVGSPEVVSDSRRANFGWGGNDGGNYGGY